MTSITRHALAATLASIALGSTILPDPAAAATALPDPAAAGIDRMGAQLQAVLAGADPTGNLVLSPLSIGAAMAMASAGAEGKTLAEMQDVLGLTMPDPNGAVGRLLSGLEGAAGETVSIANSMWAQDGFAVAPTFSATLQNAYGAELELADFAGDPAGSLQAVNDWVADATAGRIPALLGPGSVGPTTQLLLVNAVYLDADWVSPFEADWTFPADFTTGAGESVEVDTMHQTLYADYYQGSGFEAIGLPYTSGLEMVVVLPDAGGLPAFEQQFAAAGGDLSALLGGADSVEVDLALPKWDFETRAGLAGPFQALGMTLPFTDRADFSAISADVPLHISEVIHQANITVDELGTEASAATAIIEVGAAAPEELPLPFTVDRPFFFVVRDPATGTVLFAGHVNDPN